MNKKRFVALLGLCIMCSVCCFFHSNKIVHANTVVPGGGGNYGSADCQSPDGYQYYCSENYYGDRGGGMSWRIFRVPDSGYGISGLRTKSNAGLINADEAERYKMDLINGCRKDGIGWMVIWGWDWLDYGNNNDEILLGPAETPGFSVQENPYNMRLLSDLSAFQNNIKISSADALKLYNNIFPNSTAIPSTTRGFCADSKSTFEGDSAVLEVSEDNGNIGWWDVPDNKKRNTNWQNVDKLDTPTYVVDNCDPVNGCYVSFRHYLKRTAGSGSTKYKVDKSKVSGEEIEEQTGEWTNPWKKDPNFSEGVVHNELTQLRPGQKICETLSFYTKSGSNGNVSNEVSTKICAAAVATKGSDIGIEIRDEQSSVDYRNWRSGYVYAKPTDTVELKGYYTPAYQSMYNIALNAPSKTNGYDNNGHKIGETFDNNVNPNWNNAFSIKVGDDCGEGINGVVGNIDTYENVRGYSVQAGDVGEPVKKAWSVTNCSDNTRITPSGVGLTYADSTGFTATVNTDSKSSDDVEIRVPYNFVNTVGINMSDEDVVYAGESKSISYNINVGAKENSVTNGYYATPVPDASWGLEVNYGDGVWISVDTGSGNLNYGPGYSFDGKPEEKGGGSSVSIPDLPAGAEVCFRAWVWPSNSGNSDNLSKDFDEKKAFSEKCLKVAKKPSFQVWGSGIYSAGNINIPIASKSDLAGYGNGTYMFGSWAELGIVADGMVGGIASGAGMGYAINNDGTLWPAEKPLDGAGNNNDIRDRAPGGGDSTDFCKMSTLSFANIECGSGKVGFNNGIRGFVESNKEDFIERFMEGGEGVDVKKVDDDVLGDIKVASGINVYFKDNGTLIIDKDVIYGDSKYKDLDSIPRTIIYVKGNILVRCDVGRIDAVLIADGGEINTCVDSNNEVPGPNSKERSKQLTIRGALIADTLNLNRTYGAATGANSIVPAEVINYDASLYLWVEESDITKTGKMITAYQQELSPRY